MDNPGKNPQMRTDDCARQIEYVTHSKWTDEEYKKVCSILRFYQHQSIIAIMDRVAGKADDSGSGGEVKK